MRNKKVFIDDSISNNCLNTYGIISVYATNKRLCFYFCIFYQS